MFKEETPGSESTGNLKNCVDLQVQANRQPSEGYIR